MLESVAKYLDPVTLTLCLLGALLLWKLSQNNRVYPPGPKGVPILGVLPLLTSRPDKKIKEWADKYGDVMTLQLLNNKVVVINTIAALNEGPVRKGADYANRPWCYLHDEIWKRNGISTTNYSPEWKELRKFTLGSLRNFGFAKKNITERILIEVRYYCELMRTLDGNFTIGRHNLIEVNANIISQMMIGRRFDYEEEGFIKFFHNLTERFFDASFALQATVFVPWLHPFPPFRGTLRKLKKHFEELHVLIYKELDEIRDNRLKDDRRHFADEFLQEMEKRKGKNVGLFTYEMLMYILRDMFLGGTETLASTMTWSILILCNRRNTVLKKIHEEIDDVIGREADADLEHREKMPYTMAFMQEVFRFRTLLPFAIPVMTTTDTALGKYVIPKGTTILENLYAVHNDENLWNKPEEFCVERHLNSDGKFVKSPNVIPFGVGFRYCLGKTFAEMQYFLTLVTVLQNFDVVSTGEEFQDEDVAECGFVAMAPLDLKVKLVERK